VLRRSAERGAKINEAALGKVSGTALDTGAYLHKLKVLPADKQEAGADADLWDIATLVAAAHLLGDLERVMVANHIW
jgi:hypothetical protein